jgi:hypothetical protein
MTTKNDDPFKPLNWLMFALLLIVLACAYA